MNQGLGGFHCIFSLLFLLLQKCDKARKKFLLRLTKKIYEDRTLQKVGQIRLILRCFCNGAHVYDFLHTVIFGF